MKKKRKRKRKSHLLHTIEQEKVIESEEKGSKTYPKPQPYRRCLYSRRRHHPLHHHRLQRRSIGEKPSLLSRDPNHRWPPSLASPPRTTAAAVEGTAFPCVGATRAKEPLFGHSRPLPLPKEWNKKKSLFTILPLPLGFNKKTIKRQRHLNRR